MICPGPDWIVAAACFLWVEVGRGCAGASGIFGEKGGFLP
jgi:hypothetical protein